MNAVAMQTGRVLVFLLISLQLLAAAALAGGDDWITLYQFAPSPGSELGNRLELRYASVSIKDKKYLRPEVELLLGHDGKRFRYNFLGKDDYENLEEHFFVSFSADQEALADHLTLIEGSIYRSNLQEHGNIRDAWSGNTLDDNPLSEDFLTRHTYSENAPTSRTLLTITGVKAFGGSPTMKKSYTITALGKVYNAPNFETDNASLYFGGDLLLSHGRTIYEFLGMRLFLRHSRESSRRDYILVSDEGWSTVVDSKQSISDFLPTRLEGHVIRKYDGQVSMLFHSDIRVPFANVEMGTPRSAQIKTTEIRDEWITPLGTELSTLINNRFDAELLRVALETNENLRGASKMIMESGSPDVTVGLLEKAIARVIYTQFLNTGISVTPRPNETPLLAEILAGSRIWEEKRNVPLAADWIRSMVKSATENGLLSGAYLPGQQLQIHLISSNLCTLIAENPETEQLLKKNLNKPKKP